MKDITKLIRRFVGILLLSTVLVIVLNIIILAAISASQTANGRPWTTAKETAEALQKTETGYILSGDMTERLSGENAWAIYIDNDTLEVKWHTENLPDTVPLHYTISDIASLTRGYIDGYPTYTGECENGLVVVGYPKDRYWKHMSPSWDYDFIKNAPYTVLIVIGVNVFLIFLIYMIANSKGELVDTVTTDETGFAKSKELYLGKYEVKEVKAGYGMVLSSEVHTVELIYAGQDVAVTETATSFVNERQKVEVSLEKALETNELFGIGNNGEIKNISFGLFADEELVSASGTSIPKDGLLEIITLDENGRATVGTDLPLGSYYVKELAENNVVLEEYRICYMRGLMDGMEIKKIVE